MVYIIITVAAIFIWFFFNPTANRIRKINALINKDRSVCDVIMSLDNWEVTPINTGGLKMALPSSPIIKELYITYQGRRPDNSDIKYLYWELTREDSIVTKAHKANVPVEVYLENMTKAFEKFLDEQDEK